MMNDFEYALWLSSIAALELSDKFKLLRFFGSPYEIFNVKYETLEKTAFSERVKSEINRSRKGFDPDVIMNQLHRNNVTYVSFYDKDFPEKLKNLYNPPIGLFYKGRLPNPKKPSIAVIGARKCSGYGKTIAEEFSGKLGKSGCQIISGLAYGIDGFSHRAALSAGAYTLGVLGTGPDVIYPAQNGDLYHEMSEKGGVVTEYYLGTPGAKNHFPERNRLISGFADVLLVVEAKKKSGTMITVDNALEQGKDVYVIPGRIGDELSEGCLEMARTGAGIVLSPEEILAAFELSDNQQIIKGKDEQYAFKFDCVGEFSENCQKIKDLTLEKDEIILYALLSFEPIHMDELVEKSGMTYFEVLQTIMSLNTKGYIKESSPGFYVKKL